MTAPILAGAALGAGLVHVARRAGTGERGVLAAGLLVAALIYVGFAVGARDARWLLLESAGVLLIAPFAWLGRASGVWLALGWAAHVAWDVGLHLDRPQPVVGHWYPLLCVGFDLIVAGSLMARGERKP